YHARRWLESSTSPQGSRHIYPAAILSLLAFFTYLSAGVVALVIAAWLIAFRWKLLCSPKTLLVALACFIALLPAMLVIFHWMPIHMSAAIPTTEYLLRASTWSYYLERSSDLLSPHLTVLAAIGVCGGLLSRRWRQETLYLLIWLTVTYAFFSCLVAKESRYVLLLSPALICLCMVAVFWAEAGLERIVKGWSRAVIPLELAP